MQVFDLDGVCISCGNCRKKKPFRCQILQSSRTAATRSCYRVTLLTSWSSYEELAAAAVVRLSKNWLQKWFSWLFFNEIAIIMICFCGFFLCRTPKSILRWDTALKPQHLIFENFKVMENKLIIASFSSATEFSVHRPWDFFVSRVSLIFSVYSTMQSVTLPYKERKIIILRLNSQNPLRFLKFKSWICSSNCVSPEQSVGLSKTSDICWELSRPSDV